MNKADWKTKLAGILGAVYGVIGIVAHFVFDPDPTWALGVNEGLALILAGFGVFGLGAKVQKLIDVVKK